MTRYRLLGVHEGTSTRDHMNSISEKMFKALTAWSIGSLLKMSTSVIHRGPAPVMIDSTSNGKKKTTYLHDQKILLHISNKTNHLGNVKDFWKFCHNWLMLHIANQPLCRNIVAPAVAPCNVYLPLTDPYRISFHFIFFYYRHMHNLCYRDPLVEKGANILQCKFVIPNIPHCFVPKIA